MRLTRYGDDLECGHSLFQRIPQWTVVGLLGKSPGHNQLLEGAHITVETGTGQHRLGLGDRPQACRLAQYSARLTLGLPGLHEPDHGGNHRDHGDHRQHPGASTLGGRMLLIAGGNRFVGRNHPLIGERRSDAGVLRRRLFRCSAGGFRL